MSTVCKVTLFLFLLNPFCFARESKEEIALLRTEIEEYREKIAAIDSEIKTLQVDMGRDRMKREESKARSKQSDSLVRADITTLENELTQLSSSKKQNSNHAGNLEREIRQHVGKEDELILALVEECGVLLQFLETLSPLIAKRHITPVRFLQGEANKRSIGSSEGVERLLTIYNAITADSESFDVWQGRAVIGERSEYFSFVRLGLFYLAAVTEDGSRGYLYHSNQWNLLVDNAETEKLFQAVQTGMGNRTPELSVLPLVIPSDVSEGKYE